MADFIFKPSSNGSGVFSNALEFQGFDPAETVNVADGTYDIYQKVVSGFAVTKISAEFALADVGEEPVVTATNGNVSVTIASGVHAGTYTQRAPDGAALTVAMIATSATCFKLPTISGTTNAGDVLTITPGLWLYEGSDPGDQTWQQKLGGVDVAGGTDLTYVIQPADDGAQFTAEERFGGVTVESGATAIAFGPATVPAAFADANWSVATGGNASELDITIASLPGNGGAAITDVEYDIGTSGTWIPLGTATTGTSTVTMAAPATSYAIRLRAINGVGNGPNGNSESATSGATPAGWTPASDTGLVSHFDPRITADLTIISDSGTDYVVAQADKVGSNDLSKAGWPDPPASANHGFLSTLNGAQAIRFDPANYAAGGYLRDGSFVIPAGGDLLISFAADIGTSFSWPDESFFGLSDGGGIVLSITAGVGSSSVTTFPGAFRSANLGTNGTGALTGGPFSGPAIWQIIADSTAQEIYVRVDGVLVGTFDYDLATFDNSIAITFGANGVGNRSMTGHVTFGEALISTNLSTSNIDEHVTYLNGWIS